MQPQASAPATSPFVLRMPGNFWWTVRVPVPTENDYAVNTLDVLFRPQPQHRIDQYKGLALEPGQALPDEATICREVVVGWRNLPDEEGCAQPFTPDALEALLAVPVVRASIVATFIAVMQGMGARKNA